MVAIKGEDSRLPPGRVLDDVIYNFAKEYSHETGSTHEGLNIDADLQDMMIDLNRAKARGERLIEYVRSSERRFSGFLDYLSERLPMAIPGNAQMASEDRRL